MKHQFAMLFLFFLVIGSLVGMPPGNFAVAELQIANSSGSGFGDLKEDGFVGTLLSFLEGMGLDISYGDNNETIFSMVDTSLTTIISDLSSGNTEGFTNIPLINETLAYLHISHADIIVNPEEVTGTMPAIDSYNSRTDGNNAHI